MRVCTPPQRAINPQIRRLKASVNLSETRIFKLDLNVTTSVNRKKRLF